MEPTRPKNGLENPNTGQAGPTDAHRAGTATAGDGLFPDRRPTPCPAQWAAGAAPADPPGVTPGGDARDTGEGDTDLPPPPGARPITRTSTISLSQGHRPTKGRADIEDMAIAKDQGPRPERRPALTNPTRRGAANRSAAVATTTAPAPTPSNGPDTISQAAVVTPTAPTQTPTKEPTDTPTAEPATRKPIGFGEGLKAPGQNKDGNKEGTL